MRLLSKTLTVIGFWTIATGIVQARAMSLADLSENLQVQYQVISNLDNSDCESLFKGPCFTGQLRFSLLKSATTEPFALYFSHIAPIKWDSHANLDIKHINGDLHQIQFTGSEFSQQPEQTLVFKAAFWHAAHSDVMPNYFVVSEDGQSFIVQSTAPQMDPETGLQHLPHLVAHTRPEQYRRHDDDKLLLADAQWLYKHYEAMQKGTGDTKPSTPRIIPAMKQASWSGENSLSLASGVAIKWGNFIENNLLIELLAQAGLKANPDGVAIELKQDKILAAGEYRLDLTQDKILLSAADNEALQYGFVSLYQLVVLHGNQLPLAAILDAPRYQYRGVHVDVSRNFLGKKPLYQLLEQMFLLKLNKLHLHLADDEGWRLQIPGLPELTDIGGFRCFDPLEEQCLLPQLGSGPNRESPVNGYLTVKDYQELLEFAHARHIEVIPSFDLPGHARAAVKAMEARYRKFKAKEDLAAAEEFLLSDFADDTKYSSVQFYHDNTVNPCIDSTYHFIDTVIGKVKQLHQAVNAPLTTYHIGADETAGAWVNSPACKKLIAEREELSGVQDIKPMFLTRVIGIVSKHGLKAAGWSDGMHKVIDSQAQQGHQVNVWDTLFWDGHKIANEFSEKGWTTVLSNPDVLYFDFPYANHPEETGYYWASKNTDEFKVFQFMPENLAANASQWQDRMGNSYQATNDFEQATYVAGIQSQIWSEAIRTPGTFNYLMYPRLQAFAERAWHQGNWEVPLQTGQTFSFEASPQHLDPQLADWAEFSKALTAYFSSELGADINFRLPPPGMSYKANQLKVNSAWPKLEVQCRWDNTDWLTVTDTVEINSGVTSIECRTAIAETGKHSRISRLQLTSGD